MIHGRYILTANLGDSRAIVVNSYGTFKQITTDHKPELPAELQRIINSGGRVNTSRKDSLGREIGPKRVYVSAELNPGLAMSRSLGDVVAHSVGVSCQPEFYEYKVDIEDIAVVIASDGVWEVLSNFEVSTIVRKHYFTMSAEVASNQIIQLATGRWQEH
jgi:serine/threonine protein phosphatase PrpC